MQLVDSRDTDPRAQRECRINRKRFLLAGLLRTTEEILYYAQCGDWKKVESLEKSRQRELAECFADSEQEDSPLVAEALATLIHMNNRITDIVREARCKLLETRQSAEQRHQAASHYRETF